MIEKFIFNRNNVSAISKIQKSRKSKPLSDKSYLLDLPAFQRDEIHFKPGINIIFDRNGTGKTTLLSMLATSLACYKGGFSLADDGWAGQVSKLMAIKATSEEYKLSGLAGHSYSWRDQFISVCEVFHDGQKALFCDPRNVVGSITTHRDIADMTYFEHIQKDAISEASSTGRRNKNRMSEIMDVLNNHKIISGDIPVNNERKFEYLCDDDFCRNILKPRINKGPVTLLLDEPEAALDAVAIRDLFMILKNNQERTDLQIIMVSHSPLCFSLDKANFITSDENYMNKVKDLVSTGNYFSF